MAKIENIHCTICTQPISSSWQNALPPAFATLEERGGKVWILNHSPDSKLGDKEVASLPGKEDQRSGLLVVERGVGEAAVEDGQRHRHRLLVQLVLCHLLRNILCCLDLEHGVD